MIVFRFKGFFASSESGSRLMILSPKLFPHFGANKSIPNKIPAISSIPFSTSSVFCPMGMGRGLLPIRIRSLLGCPGRVHRMGRAPWTDRGPGDSGRDRPEDWTDFALWSLFGDRWLPGQFIAYLVSGPYCRRRIATRRWCFRSWILLIWFPAWQYRLSLQSTGYWWRSAENS